MLKAEIVLTGAEDLATLRAAGLVNVLASSDGTINTVLAEEVAWQESQICSQCATQRYSG